MARTTRRIRLVVIVGLLLAVAVSASAAAAPRHAAGVTKRASATPTRQTAKAEGLARARRAARAKVKAAAKAKANSLVPAGIPGSWNLIFNDDFGGNSLDETKWNPNWYGTSDILPSDGVQSSDDSCDSPAEVSTANGDLSLGVSTTPCVADNGVSYPDTGSLINTWGKFQFTYGYLEARIYVPSTSTGKLINSLSFWADGTGTWPSTGELDVMELLNGCGPNSTGPGFGYHFHSTSGGPGGCVPQDSTGGWHTFGADWQPGRVTYYYDGRNVGAITQGITSSPMYLILSQSVNTTWGSQSVQSAQARVDYVRVWQRTRLPIAVSSSTHGALAERGAPSNDRIGPILPSS